MIQDNRTQEELLEHYKIEKELASKLRNASKEERKHLYTSLYDELFKRVPLHPQLTRKKSLEETKLAVNDQINCLKSFLTKNISFLEVGAGDCALSLEVTKYVKQVFAIDVSNEVTRNSKNPDNFHLIISDGCSIPVPEKSINVIYSNQLMEHLHPDDALEQLQNIYNALVPEGIYVCITPTRLTGPHDISKYFDKVATGFHLKEYTITEMNTLLRKIGFSNVKLLVRTKSQFITIPLIFSLLCERFVGIMPDSLAKSIARKIPFRLFLNIRLVAIK